MIATIFQAAGCRELKKKYQRVYASFPLRKVHRCCHVTLVLRAYRVQLSHMATSYKEVWENHMGKSLFSRPPCTKNCITIKEGENGYWKQFLSLLETLLQERQRKLLIAYSKYNCVLSNFNKIK